VSPARLDPADRQGPQVPAAPRDRQDRAPRARQGPQDSPGRMVWLVPAVSAARPGYAARGAHKVYQGHQGNGVPADGGVYTAGPGR